MQATHVKGEKESSFQGLRGVFFSTLFVVFTLFFIFGGDQAKACDIEFGCGYGAASSGILVTYDDPTGTLLINGGAEYTNSLDVSLTLEADNTVLYTEFVNGSTQEDFAATSFISKYTQGEVVTSDWTLEDNLEVCVKLRSRYGTHAVVCDTIKFAEGVGGGNPWEFEFYLVNPDGTKPSRTEVTQKDGVDHVHFEDTLEGVHTNADSDFNDFVVEMEQKEDSLIVRAKSVNAAWHHQVRVKVMYQGKEVEDILLWRDSHRAKGSQRTVRLKK